MCWVANIVQGEPLRPLLEAEAKRLRFSPSELADKLWNDTNIVHSVFGSACYIESSWPSVLYLAWKYSGGWWIPNSIQNIMFWIQHGSSMDERHARGGGVPALVCYIGAGPLGLKVLWWVVDAESFQETSYGAWCVM
jgi:hypothetical protein